MSCTDAPDTVVNIVGPRNVSSECRSLLTTLSLVHQGERMILTISVQHATDVMSLRGRGLKPKMP